MKENSILWSMRHVLVPVAALLAATALGCGDDDDDSEPPSNGGTGATAAGGNGDAGNAGEGGSGGSDPLPQCPATDPPYDDPYCINPGCPFSDLPGLTEKNTPKGNCCNTVDVKRREEEMSAGERDDLELAFLSNLPGANPHLMNDLVRDTGLKAKQDIGGDLTLIRIRDVPRTEDHPKDSEGNPEGLALTMQMGAGKINCDGTFSFYGENAAPEPVYPEAGTPDDPGRWAPQSVDVTFYGMQGESLYAVAEETTASAGLKWAPRWLNDGSGLEYEMPVRFLYMTMKNSDLDSHYSCLGMRTAQEDWDAVGIFWAFVPMEETKSITAPLLLGQTICGLFAKGYGGGDCDDAQSTWASQPPAYCDENTGFCWMGDPDADFYDEFWADAYEGQDGCDPSGAGDRPCCDPAAEDDTLAACNAFPYVGEVVVAAVDITDGPVDDPDDAISIVSLCE